MQIVLGAALCIDCGVSASANTWPVNGWSSAHFETPGMEHWVHRCSGIHLQHGERVSRCRAFIAHQFRVRGAAEGCSLLKLRGYLCWPAAGPAPRCHLLPHCRRCCRRQPADACSPCRACQPAEVGCAAQGLRKQHPFAQVRQGACPILPGDASFANAGCILQVSCGVLHAAHAGDCRRRVVSCDAPAPRQRAGRLGGSLQATVVRISCRI
jgi:hypothetical protein